MRLKNQLIPFVFILFTSCKSGNLNESIDPCKDVTTIDALEWAKALLTETETRQLPVGTRFLKYGYNGASVFLYEEPVYGTQMQNRTLFNCQGEVLLTSNAEIKRWTDFEEKRSDEKELFKKYDSTCGSQINACGVVRFEELGWLQAVINQTTNNTNSCYIYKGAHLYLSEYKGQRVFYLDNFFSSLGRCGQRVFDCSGNILLDVYSSSANWNEFYLNRNKQCLLWIKN